MFAAHHRLSRLVAIVDVNGQQALGYTRDVLDLEPLAARWESFGWDVHEVDGHDRDVLGDTVRASRGERGSPRRAGANHVRQGREVHGEPNRVALPAADRRRVRPRGGRAGEGSA